MPSTKKRPPVTGGENASTNEDNEHKLPLTKFQHDPFEPEDEVLGTSIGTTTNASPLQDKQSEQRQSRGRDPDPLTFEPASPTAQLTGPAPSRCEADTATLASVDDAAGVEESKLTDHLTYEGDAATPEIGERQACKADNRSQTPESPGLSKAIKTIYAQRTSTSRTSRKKPRLSITVDTQFPRVDFIRSSAPSPPQYSPITTPRANNDPTNTTNNQSNEAPPSPPSLQQPAPTTPSAAPLPTTPTTPIAKPIATSPHTPTRPISLYGPDGITPPPTQNSRYLRTLRDSDAKARALEASFALQDVVRHGDTVACSHSPPCEGCEGVMRPRRERFDWDEGGDGDEEGSGGVGKGYERMDSAGCGEGDGVVSTGWWYEE